MIYSHRSVTVLQSSATRSRMQTSNLDSGHTMSSHFLLLLLLYFSCDVPGGLSYTRSCPRPCSCILDDRGRNTVQCTEGGFMGSLSEYLADMSDNTEVLRITAPEDNMNSMMMSPEFDKVKNIEEIHITRSNIPILGMHFFYGLKRLQILNLSQNNITQPLDHNFRGLVRLSELYLDDNRISSLPSGTFRYMVDLKVLSIQRNRIHEMMPRMFQELKKLRVLKISGNSFGSLSAEVFKDIPELRVLECRACALTQIDTSIYKLLPQLTHLDLGDNSIVHISADEFHDMQRLKQLKLDGNGIELVPDKTFMRQLELKKLSLARNRIGKVSMHAFDHMANLTDLDLAHNKLVHLKSAAFQTIANTLEKLSLSGNDIPVDEVQEIIYATGQVKEMHLNEMGFTEVPAQFVTNNVLVLSLARNHLSKIEVDALPTNLAELDISRNIFRGLDEESVYRLESIPRLKLDGNPWSCDMCYILPMHAITNRSAAMYNVRCATPFQHENQLLGTLRREHLTWCNSASYSSEGVNFYIPHNEATVGLMAAGASVCLILLTAVAALIALLCSRRHSDKYYTHEEKRSDEREVIFESGDQAPAFPEELSFKFPLDADKKIYVATIDEITKKDHQIRSQSNGGIRCE